jgi:hypothetical protein
MFNDDDEIQTIVVENGTCMMKAGFAGDHFLEKRKRYKFFLRNLMKIDLNLFKN